MKGPSRKAVVAFTRLSSIKDEPKQWIYYQLYYQLLGLVQKAKKGKIIRSNHQLFALGSDHFAVLSYSSSS